MFYDTAPTSPQGNANNPQTCKNMSCGRTFYVKLGAQWIRCPYCQHNQ